MRYKGKISIEAPKGRLRLCWRVDGRRYYLSLGLEDTPVNRRVAQAKATLIDQDIINGDFDTSLERYKSRSLQPRRDITVVQLFDRWLRYKADKVDPRTIEKYQALRTRLEEFFQSGVAVNVDESRAIGFRDYLLQHQVEVTVVDRLSTLRSCWQWGLRQKLVEENPWADVKVKIPPKQPPKPFTLEEIKTILKAFRESRYYRHYADFVEFLFGTGCRTGEAIGLRWSHVSEDFSTVWIGEIVSRNRRKSAKRNKSRVVPLTPRLQKLLSDRGRGEPDDLVFPAPKGGAIRDDLFRKRAWKAILTACGIEYRKPYLTRSTLVSHALDQGMPPALVASLTGHSVRVIYSNYAGNIRGGAKLPELDY